MRHFATTEPGNPVVVRDKLYKGRLDVTADGSLIITNLSRGDQGIYKANIDRQISGQCTQIYGLKVYGVIGALCGERRNVSGIEGGDVTLPVDQTEIRDISWVTDKRIIARTEPGKPVVVREKLYNGRLDVTADGSLIITNLSREDQGIYTADIQGQSSEQCTQIYYLTIYDGNFYRPSITQSNIIEDDKKLRENFPGRTQKADYITMNIVRLTLSACVLLITCCLFTHHMKTEVMKPSGDSD
ncbi:cell adhesion molecule CEACAM3-like isoform X2 [Mixophyes fleayi]